MKQSSPIFFSAKAPPAVYIVQSVLTCTLTYHHYDSQLSCYLSALLCTHQTSRTLQPSSEKLMKIPNCNLKSFGEHSFSFIAPPVWNSLPAFFFFPLPTLSEFKAQLNLISYLEKPSHKSKNSVFCVYVLCMYTCSICAGLSVHACMECASEPSFPSTETLELH